MSARVDKSILKDGGHTYQGLPPSMAAVSDKFQDLTQAIPASEGGVPAATGTGPARNQNTAATLYPSKFFRKVPEEDELHTLTNAIGTWANDSNAPFTKPELPQSAVDLVQKKQRQAFEKGLHEWIEQNYDLENPVNVKYVMELWPEYFESKKETINEAIELLRKTAYLNLMSGYIQPGDEETKQFVIALAMGFIDVDRNILGRYILPTEGDWTGKERPLIERGLFSPLRYPTDAKGQIQGGITNLLKGSTQARLLNLERSSDGGNWSSIWDSFRNTVGGGQSGNRANAESNASRKNRLWGGQ